MNQQKSQVLFRRIQSIQATAAAGRDFKEHKIKCIYPMIICGDMNNSVFVCISIKGS
jgi:hypothetical protein